MSVICGYALGIDRSDSGADSLPFLVMVVAVFLTRRLRVAIHEAGHAVVAKGVGREVFAVTLGSGPRIWARRIGGTLGSKPNQWLEVTGQIMIPTL